MVLENFLPVARRDWGFFDRQRSIFNEMFKGMDDEFRQFNEELERARKELLSVTGNETMLKVGRPVVEDKEGNKRLALRFDVSQFKPEEVTVKTQDNKLTVQAKHSEEAPGRKVYQEYTKTYELPQKIDPATITSILSKDGILSIEAPAPAALEAPKEKILPIKYL